MPQTSIRLAAVLVVLSVAPAAGQTKPPVQAPSAVSDSASSWARNLAGAWSCAGAFASGRPLAADLRFTPVLGGRWLEYHHTDRPPGSYEARALWGPALHDSALTSAIIYDDFGGHRRFFAAPTPPGGIQLTRDTLEAGARMERFSFQPRPDGSLWFAWEVLRGGSWVLGDSLGCTRSGA